MSKGNENEPAKLLLPFLQRADELQTHDPLVAYYCMSVPSSHPADSNIIICILLIAVV